MPKCVSGDIDDIASGVDICGVKRVQKEGHVLLATSANWSWIVRPRILLSAISRQRSDVVGYQRTMSRVLRRAHRYRLCIVVSLSVKNN